MRKILSVTAPALVFLLSACTPFTPTLDEAGVVEFEIVERAPPPDIYFVHAYRSSDETVIRGRLKYPVWSWFKTFPGHIDLIVEPPGDRKITLHDVAVIRKRLPKKRGREAFFVARVATDTPKGTRVTVEYSDKNHESRM